ncbi:MAG: hypothetical protein JWP44_3560 [Mucilaginibacter sp.]|nr:hypothetical protein [Mucilaginibacter sp.]
MKPLAKKLLFKPGTRWLFYNAPANYLSLLEPMPECTEALFVPDGDFDGIQLFVKNSNELVTSLAVIAPLLKSDTIFWITYPKKSSGIESDLEMMGSWDAPAKYGLQIVASAAVNETWTALRLRKEGLSKKSASSNEAIRNSEYAGFIDVGNKQVRLPPAMQEALTQFANAMAFYQTLSYSNKKEYVVWILSAKQEKTKNERLGKLVEKLLAGKKNPSDKEENR